VTRAISAGHRSAIVAFAGITLALSACAGAPEITHQVLVPPPSAPRTEFFIEKVQVQSRETGAEAWQRNEQYGRVLTDALKDALRAQDKTLAPPPADSIRPKLYFGRTAVKTKGERRTGAQVEVRLELIDGASGAVRYSTYTQTPIDPSMLSKFGWAPEADELIRDILQKSAQDFVSRL